MSDITDAQRLEFLERIAWTESGNCDRDEKGYYKLRLPNGTDYYKSGQKLSFRDAIDAQIRKSNKAAQAAHDKKVADAAQLAEDANAAVKRALNEQGDIEIEYFDEGF